eukprot:gnl/MRDRNA2_/MRDRNA2_88669_c0_seq1.p1 gnl/MRDRNA2_/MRDRNA2_88669_c0~~gnl/MRDRNA2_/MRDRNA2_88669_c0_seq1.p1  ORF type:complete len:291 (+),score=62.27 gnl/MRDRNA2_/MRDRNA2_88669_c0_seq1:115-987(+)
MFSVFVLILFSLVAQAHPDDSIDKLGDKLAFTLSKSVEKLGDTMAHSVDKLGDTLADKLADRVAMMQSPHPKDLDKTVHAKPVAKPRAGHMGFPSQSLKSPSLHAPSAAARPLEYDSKATVGRVNLRDLYNPVHTAAEAKALAQAGLGYHVRSPAPFTGEHKMTWPGQLPEFETAERGAFYHKFRHLPGGHSQRPFKSYAEVPEFVPRAFKNTPETTPRRPFEFDPLAAEFVPKGFESPLEMSSGDTEHAMLTDADLAAVMMPTRAPALDIDSVIDKDIKSRRTRPGKHV